MDLMTDKEIQTIKITAPDPVDWWKGGIGNNSSVGGQHKYQKISL